VLELDALLVKPIHLGFQRHRLFCFLFHQLPEIHERIRLRYSQMVVRDTHQHFSAVVCQHNRFCRR
jgi:hypothetical protein